MEKETNSRSCKGRRSATKRHGEKEGAEAEQTGLASNCPLNEWIKWAESSEQGVQWDPELNMTSRGLIRLME